MGHAIDGGLLLLRVFLGALLASHGAQKLLGWFNGYGIEGTGGYFEMIGYPRGKIMAVLAGLTEGLGGIGLAAGLLTPIVSLAFVGLFANVAVAGHGRSFWNHNQPSGIEYPLVLGIGTGIFSLIGPGAFSVDRAFGWWLYGWGWFAASVTLGLLVGAGVLAWRRPPTPAQEAEEDPSGRAAA
jgi:putative oxidoreductase